VRQGEREAIGFRADVLGPWAAPVTLVVGRRLKDLLPGALLVEAAPRGAESLDLAVRRVPRLVAELTTLQLVLPNLRPAVRDAIAAVLARDPRGIEKELARGNGVEARADAALACHLRGLAILAERRPREAIAEFDAALRCADDFAPAAYSLAVAHRRAGEKDTAANVMRSYAKSHPADPDAASLLARFLGEAGDRYGARRAYREAIRRFPDALQIRVAFALELQTWGDGRGAAEQFDVVRRAQPADARLAFLAGRARVSAGRGADAVEALEQAAQTLTGTERAEAMFWLVSALRGEGRHDRAVVIAGELVDGLGRDQVEMLDDVAEYLEERQDYTRARRAAKRARRLRGGEW
jgi:tetratricopeptide (TPR) repeat protein